MNQSENQSTIIQGVGKAVSEIALEDLGVQNADAIKGGDEVKPQKPIVCDELVVKGDRPKPQPQPQPKP